MCCETNHQIFLMCSVGNCCCSSKSMLVNYKSELEQPYYRPDFPVLAKFKNGTEAVRSFVIFGCIKTDFDDPDNAYLDY